RTARAAQGDPPARPHRDRPASLGAAARLPARRGPATSRHRPVIMDGRILIVGTGLIGTSVALALRERGADVSLADRDAAALRLATELGAGEPLRDGAAPADVAVLAVPPAAVAATLLDAQKRGLARVYTDVASVKVRPL